MDLTDKLRTKTESARCHIDGKEIMGMINAAKNIDSLEQEKRNEVVQMSVTMGRKQRQANTRKSLQIKHELSRQIALKREQKQTTERNKIKKLLKTTD